MQHIKLPWPRLYHSQIGGLAGDHTSLVVVAVKKDPHELNDYLVDGAKMKCSVAGSNRRHWTKHRGVLGPHHNQLDQPSAEIAVSFLHTHCCLVFPSWWGLPGLLQAYSRSVDHSLHSQPKACHPCHLRFSLIVRTSVCQSGNTVQPALLVCRASC